MGEVTNTTDSLGEPKQRFRKKDLRHACEKGDVALVQKLIEHGVSVDAADRRGKSALIYACMNGHTDVVELLLNNDVDANRMDKEGMTALRYAADNKHTDIVDILVSHGVNLSKSGHYHIRHPLYWACFRGHEDVVKLLIKDGCDVNLKWKTTALIIACEHGYGNIVEILVGNGAIVDEIDQERMTALMVACRNGDESLVRTLIRLGADIHKHGRRRKTALTWAVKKDQKNVVDILISLGAYINMRDDSFWKKTILMHAAKNGSVSSATVLLESGAGINVTDAYGRTALIYACSNGHLEMVNLLLRYNAEVDVVFQKSTNKPVVSDTIKHSLFKDTSSKNTQEIGETALMEACRGGYDDIVEVLLSHGASTDIVDKHDMTLLLHALNGRHEKVVEVLLNKVHDLNVNVQDKDGMTALMYACTGGMTKTFDRLLTYGANPNFGTRPNSTTLLQHACELNNCGIISSLLKRNVSIDERGYINQTALTIAAGQGCSEIVSTLLQNGANPNLEDDHGNSALYHCLRNTSNRAGANRCLKMLLANENTEFNSHERHHVFDLAVSSNNLEAIMILKDSTGLLLNGRLSPECIRGNDYIWMALKRHKIKAETLVFIMEQDLFEWKMCTSKLWDILQLFTAAIRAGICPGIVYEYENPVVQNSPIWLSFCKKKPRVMDMLIQHLYFFSEDYEAIQSQRVIYFPERFLRIEVIHDFITQPLSLVKWSFLVISKSISLAGSPCKRGERVDALPLPEKFKRRLKFKIDCE